MTRRYEALRKRAGVYIVQLRNAREQGLLQEFSDGGLTLPMRGLECGFQGAINARNLRKNCFSSSDGWLACSDWGYSPLTTPWHHPCSRVLRSAISAMNKRFFQLEQALPLANTFTSAFIQRHACFLHQNA